MANPWTGEVALVIDGRRCVLKLTLGALAGLEQAVEAGSLVALVERFESGGYRSRDVIAVIEAGLRGGGCEPVDLMTAEIGGGPMAAARTAAQLLARAFMVPGET